MAWKAATDFSMDPDLTSDLSQWDSHNQASSIQLAMGDLEEMSARAHLVRIHSSQSMFYLFFTSSLKVTNLFDNRAQQGKPASSK